MFLIVGLGNPGEKYEETRHNVGAILINELEYSNLKEAVLVKPQTFMNSSGKAVKKRLKELNLKPENLIVVHDDLDIPLGELRISKDRGAAGHKGVESIIKTLGTKNFIRFRIGILPQLNKPKNPEKFVLQKFNRVEKKIIKQTVQKTVRAIEMVLKQGLEKTMNSYNR